VDKLWNQHDYKHTKNYLFRWIEIIQLPFNKKSAQAPRLPNWKTTAHQTATTKQLNHQTDHDLKTQYKKFMNR
jgi:hypothetical protein